jgi:hypothetical protein
MNNINKANLDNCDEKKKKRKKKKKKKKATFSMEWKKPVKEEEESKKTKVKRERLGINAKRGTDYCTWETDNHRRGFRDDKSRVVRGEMPEELIK